VAPGQRVTFRRPAPVEPEAPRELPVLVEDAAFYALDKPAGIAMHPTAKFHHSTVTSVLRERFPAEALQITHRLDLETSGIVLVARTAEVAVALKRAFARRQVQKRYLALVHGALDGIPTSASLPRTRTTAGRPWRTGCRSRATRCTRPGCAFRTR
jgi:23S rRNA pseudouridine1911/1915/1917 synthase